MIRHASLAVRMAWVLAALGPAGCASWGTAPPAPPDAGPVPIAADDAILQTLVGSWSSVAASRTGLRSGIVLKLSGPQGDRRLSQNVTLERPANLRMEIQAFLTTAAVLVANGSEYDYFQSFDRYRENGPVHPHLLWQIAGVPLTLSQAIDFLMGGVPQRPGLQPGGGGRFADGTVRVDLHDSTARRVRSLWFAPEGQLTRAAEWSADERLRWQVGYDRYRDVGGQPFAHTLEFEFPRYESRATVAFRTVELNPAIADGVFELRIPGDGASSTSDGARP